MTIHHVTNIRAIGQYLEAESLSREGDDICALHSLLARSHLFSTVVQKLETQVSHRGGQAGQPDQRQQAFDCVNLLPPPHHLPQPCSSSSKGEQVIFGD